MASRMERQNSHALTETGDERRRRVLGSIPRVPPLPHAATRPTRRVAGHPEWQAEIILAQDVPAFARRYIERGLARNVPAIVPVASNESVAGILQKAVLCEISDVVLEQHETRTPPGEVETVQHLELVPFDVD